MATTMKRLPARTSATLRATIDQAGPVSAATRALLWLGADAAGLPISPVGRREIAALLAEEALAPDVIAALQRLYDQLGSVRVTETISAHLLDATIEGTMRPQAPLAVVPPAVATERLAARPVGAHMLESGDNGDPFANVGMEFAN